MSVRVHLLRGVAALLGAGVLAVGLPAAVAGASTGVPAGEVVPITCPSDPHVAHFGGLDTTDRYVSLWVPGGANVSFSATGAMKTHLHGSDFDAEYVFHAFVRGGVFGDTESEVYWGLSHASGPPNVWHAADHPTVAINGFTNTGPGGVLTFRLVASRGFTGDDARWDLQARVDGGDGSAFIGCGKYRPDGASRGRAPANEAVEDPVDTATGNLFDSFTDLTASAGLSGMDVTRAYNSTDPVAGVMGTGWTEPYGAFAAELPGYVDLRLLDGRVVRFAANGSTFDRPQELTAGLSRDADGSLRLTFNGGVVWEFDAAGRLERTTDASGVSATVTRDSAGRVTTVVSSAGGASLAFSYTGDRLTGVTASDGRSVAYGYTAGRLTSFTDAAGKVWTYGYDGSGWLNSVTDPTGVVVMSCEYATGARVVAQTTPDGGAVTFAYDSATRTTTHTVVATGEVLQYVHDVDGRLVRIVDPSSAAVGRRVGSWGFWDQSTSRTNVVSSSQRDGRGNVTSAVDPASGTLAVTYDERDRPLTVSDPKTGTTTYSYTGSGSSPIPSSETNAIGASLHRVVVDGLVTSETDADGVTTSLTYTPARQVATRSVGGGAPWTFAYGPQGWLKTQTSPEGRVTSYEYDGAGRVTKVTTPGNTAGTFEVTSYVYDGAGRLLTTTDPTGAVTTRTYNAQGLLASEAKPGKPATTFTYDALGQLTKVTDPSGVFTETGYGPLGRVVWTKDGAGRQTSYTYRDDGQLATTTAPDGGVTTNTYDSAGRLWKVTDPAGRVTTTTYDAAGRVWKVTAPDGGVTETVYDAVGRVSKVIDPTGRQTLTTYTDAGRTKTVTDPAGVATTTSYDPSGRVWKSSDLLGNTTVTGYTADGLVDKVVSPSSLSTTFAYTPAGRVSTVTDPAGVVTTFGWSARGEKVSEQLSGRSAVTFGYHPDGTMAWSKDARGNQTTYAYDAAGRRTGRTTAVSSESWGYTDGELTSYTAPPVNGVARVTSYTRDTAGRVATVTDPSGRSVTDTYTTAGDLTSRVFAQPGAASITYGYGYDTAGRPTTVAAPDGIYVTAYDAAGRVTGVTPPDGRYVLYAYDNGGRVRQVTTADGLELVYGYDSVGRVSTISPNSTLTDWFTGNDGAGADPAKWTRQAVSGGSAAIDVQRLRLTTTNTAGSSMGVTSTAAQTADSITSVSFQAASNTAANQSRFTVGIRQNAANTAGYRVEALTDQATGKLIKRVAGVDTVLGTFALPAAGTDTRVSIEAAGSTIRAKAWATNVSQPAAWGVSVTDSSITAAGATQIRTDRVAGTNSVAIDNYRQRNTPAVALAPYVTNTYNADSQVTNEAMAGGSRAYTYTTGRVTKVVQTVPGANRTTDVTYDTAGAIKTTAVAGVTTTYGYDAASQLTSVTPSTGGGTSYAYDAAGRRTSQTQGAVTTTYAYNSASQLLSATPSSGAATTTYSYDLAGRRVSETTGAAVTTNTWDAAGQLRGVTKTNGGTTVTAELRNYTPDGLLRENTITGAGGAFLRYLKFDWDRNRPGVPQLVSTLEGETNYGIVRNNTTGTLVASTRGNTPTLFGLDVFGSPVNSTNQPFADATGWDAFGAATGATAGNAKATFGYRGELTILGDTNLRARSYDARTGQFTSVDPLDDVPGTPTSGNPYHYADNNPTNRIDPSGLRPNDESVDECASGSWLTKVLCHPDAAVSVLTAIAQAAVILAATVYLTPVFPAAIAAVAVFQAGVAVAAAYYDCRDGWSLNCGVSAAVAVAAVLGGAKAYSELPAGIYESLAARPGAFGERGSVSLPGGGSPNPPPGAQPAATEGPISSTLETNGTKFIYGDRVLGRAVEEAGPYHNFPAAFDETILTQGTRTVVSDGYVEYTLAGRVNGVDGVYEIGTRPTALGDGEVITHRFFSPGGSL